jgi:hypothetical protein
VFRVEEVRGMVEEESKKGNNTYCSYLLKRSPLQY